MSELKYYGGNSAASWYGVGICFTPSHEKWHPMIVYLIHIEGHRAKQAGNSGKLRLLLQRLALHQGPAAGHHMLQELELGLGGGEALRGHVGQLADHFAHPLRLGAGGVGRLVG